MVAVAVGDPALTLSNPSKPYKYYVGAGGIVISAFHRTDTVDANKGHPAVFDGAGSGKKRRAATTAVYEVTGYSGFATGDNNTDRNELNARPDTNRVIDVACNMRIMGVAYDGISSVQMASACADPHANARIAVMMSGVATIPVPYQAQQKHMSMKNAHIGDAVLVNVFERPDFNFTGDPEEFTGWAVGFVPRTTWTAFLANPNGNGGNYMQAVGTAAFGPAGTAQFAAARAAIEAPKLLRLLLGYVQDTGGRVANEVRVQLQLHPRSHAVTIQAASLNAGMLDTDSGAVAAGAPKRARVASAFGQVVQEEFDKIPAAPGGATGAQASFLGLVGSAVQPNGTVGTVPYAAVDGSTAARVMASGGNAAAGLGDDGVTAAPGTFAGEMLMAGETDPRSRSKLTARTRITEAFLGGTAAPVPTGAVWSPSPGNESEVAGTPHTVVRSLGLHAETGPRAWVPAPKTVAIKAADGSLISAAARGQTIDVYPDTAGAKRFAQNDLPEAMRIVGGKMATQLSPGAQSRIVDAAHAAIHAS